MGKNLKELNLEDILGDIPEYTANMQLPDNNLRDFYQDELDRVIWLVGEVDEKFLDAVSRIMKYNKEDKDIPVEERKPIKLIIDTLGGSVVIMWTLVNAIKISKTPVWTINWCGCYSAGAHILAAGHKRFAMPGSTVLIHSGSCYLSGNQEQVDNAKKYYDGLGKLAEEELLKSTTIDKKVFNRKKVNDWYLTAEEALNNHIIDRIIEDYSEIF